MGFQKHWPGKENLLRLEKKGIVQMEIRLQRGKKAARVLNHHFSLFSISLPLIDSPGFQFTRD